MQVEVDAKAGERFYNTHATFNPNNIWRNQKYCSCTYTLVSSR
jgi:hypothetical protein